ncbi:MAG: hypothetical protein HC822_02935 [Oscillochloris sp.]|nr:hypothetical protein [Oscillochloris sp.]
MNRIGELLITDLRQAIHNLGCHGGLISASIYDTAQVVRLAPPEEGVWPALNWLLAQQRSDGGWGDVDAPRTRDVPTLASILALRPYVTRKPHREAVQEGIAFLRRQATYWNGPLPDDIPVGSELLLPKLLDDVRSAGLDISPAPYTRLSNLGQERLALIHRIKPAAATSAVHSWEGWGQNPDPTACDPTGGVGHSPAATAAWIAAARHNPQTADQCDLARRYLVEASQATGEAIPGVVPTVWPIYRFEATFALYTLLMADLLDHPLLQAVVQPRIDELVAAFGTHGVGFSDHFETDGDTTAAAMAVLTAAGRDFDRLPSTYYRRDQHFCCYPHELQISLSATARFVHALQLLGEDVRQFTARLETLQNNDGRWISDKWHCSWLYPTILVIQALKVAGDHQEALQLALRVILDYQRSDGGWGSTESSSSETAYAVLALRMLGNDPLYRPAVAAALSRARRFMFEHYRPLVRNTTLRWIGKELYQPYQLIKCWN